MSLFSTFALRNYF